MIQSQVRHPKLLLSSMNTFSSVTNSSNQPHTSCLLGQINNCQHHQSLQPDAGLSSMILDMTRQHTAVFAMLESTFSLTDIALFGQTSSTEKPCGLLILNTFHIPWDWLVGGKRKQKDGGRQQHSIRLQPSYKLSKGICYFCHFCDYYSYCAFCVYYDCFIIPSATNQSQRRHHLTHKPLNDCRK